MENQTTHKLPFWETLGRSFKYSLKNKQLLLGILPVILVLVFIQIALNLPFACSFGAGQCSTGAGYYLTLLSFVAAASGIIINYCRSIICKADVDFTSFRFWRQLGLYIAAKIVMLLIIMLPSVAVIMAIAYLSGFSEAVLIAGIVLVPLLFSILFAPLFLIFPAIAVEDYQTINRKKLFETTKGNYNAIFWSQLILSVPYWILFRMCIEIYQIIGINNYLINLLFVIAAMFLAMIDACFKGAYFAHIYQFFKFYDKN